MSSKTSNKFPWRIAASCLLIFDYFLFTTGNPSITYSIFGGWFWVTLLGALMIIASSVPREGERRAPFILHLFIAGVFSVALLTTSAYAREFALVRIEAEIASFANDPVNSKADVSNEERQLMVKVKSQKYFMEREAFIPTFRRMDYLFKVETGEKYRLIMTMDWSGNPKISFRHVES